MIFSIYFCSYNHELLNACCLLKEYAQYVAQVRAYAEELPLREAVEKAVDNCIKNNILSDFLAKNRAEAIAVSIFEYDEEKHIKSERKEWREIGYREGHDAGREEGLAAGRASGATVVGLATTYPVSRVEPLSDVVISSWPELPLERLVELMS